MTWRDEATRTRDAVDLRVPADPAYLAVIRTATAGLASRLDLTIDAIEDLRIAVDEACALLLAGRPHPGQQLHTQFSTEDGVLHVLIHGPARTLVDRGDFAWSVLKALAGTVETGRDDEGTWIRLEHQGGRAVS